MRRPSLFTASLYAFAGVLLFANTWSTSLSANDTALHAGIARHMAESHRIGTPELYGAPWFEHTPPFLWLAALSFSILGFGPGQARLPFLLLALATVIATAALAKKKAGPFAGFAAGIALVTTEPFWRYAGRVRPDIPLVLFIVLAAYFAERAAERRDQPGPWIAFGFSFGFAAFFKGPMALAAPAALAGALLAKGAADRSRWLRRPGPWLGLAAAILVPVPWVIYELSQNGEAWFDRYVIHQVLWLPLHDRSSPHDWLMVPTTLLRIYWPWVLVLVLAIVRMARKGMEEVLPFAGVLGWAIFVIGVLTFSVRQTEYYLLPAYPAFAILAGAEIARWVTGEARQKRIAAAFIAAAALLLGLVTFTPLNLRRGSLEIETERIEAMGPILRSALSAPNRELGALGFNKDRVTWTLSLGLDLARKPVCFETTEEAVRFLESSDHILLLDDERERALEAATSTKAREIGRAAGLVLLQGAASSR